MRNLIGDIICGIAALLVFFSCDRLNYQEEEYDIPVLPVESFSRYMKIDSEYHGHYLQSVQILDDVVYVFYDSGHCKCYDYNTHEMISEFDLASSSENSHCGNANFSINNTKHEPLLYISGNLVDKTATVERMSLSGSKVVQTIKFDDGAFSYGQSLVVDDQNDRMFLIQRTSYDIKERGHFRLYQFSIPSLDNSFVALKKRNATMELKMYPYVPLYQGSVYKDGFIYLSHGYQEDMYGIKASSW